MHKQERGLANVSAIFQQEASTMCDQYLQLALVKQDPGLQKEGALEIMSGSCWAFV